MSTDRCCLNCGDAIPTQDTPCACSPLGDDAPRGRHSTLTTLLSVLGDLATDDEGAPLRDCYGIDLDHGDAPLDVALREWVDAGMPGRAA